MQLTVKLKDKSPPTMRTSDFAIPDINQFPILNEATVSKTVKVNEKNN